MQESDFLALIALLVSLIALFIALTQLLQSSALTAEGWRHCNATNMGQWSVFSRRKWLWSELRCEVRYTTPFIKLMDTSTFYDIGGRDKNTNVFVKPTEIKGTWNRDTHHMWEKICQRLGKHTAASNPEEEGWGLVFVEGSTFNRPESNIARAASHILGFGTLPNGIEQYWWTGVPSSSSHARSIWWSYLRWFQGYHFRFEPRQLVYGSIRAKSMSITWDGLLGRLLRSQRANFETRTRESNVDDVTKLRETQRLSIPLSTRIDCPSRMSALREGETIFALDLERRSWDFLPPDITRPLAQSTMKTVVILARRLGMRWRTFDLYREQFRAEGNGCSLTATNVRGIGIVFRFDTSYLGAPQPVLCSASADKGYFGIVPGDKAFRIEDYPLVDDKCESDIDILVKSLGKEAKDLRDLLYLWGRIVVNDATALICPFMPLPNSRKPRVFTAIATRSDLELMAKLSLFCAFGSDESLRSHLNKQLAAILKDNTEETANLQFPSSNSSSVDSGTTLKSLFDNHQSKRSRVRPIKEDRSNNDGVKGGFKISPTSGRSGDQVNSDDMNTGSDVEILRKIHCAITEEFYNQSSLGGLMHLVQAHTKFVSDYLLKWYRETPEGKKRPNVHFNHANNDLSDGWDTLLGFCRGLMGNLEPFRRNLKEISQDYGKKFSDDELDKLWWMLVARGTAWQLSVDVVLHNYKDLVPSSVYESEMAVWIE